MSAYSYISRHNLVYSAGKEFCRMLFKTVVTGQTPLGNSVYHIPGLASIQSLYPQPSIHNNNYYYIMSPSILPRQLKASFSNNVK